MFDTEVDQNGVFALAGPRADGDSNSGNNLQASAEIVRPSNCWAYEQAMRKERFVRSGHTAMASPKSLQQNVELWMGQPDEALAEVESGDGGLLSRRVSRRRSDGSARIEMHHPAGCQYHAGRQIRLYGWASESPAGHRVPRGSEQANSRSDSQIRVPISNKLVAIM